MRLPDSSLSLFRVLMMVLLMATWSFGQDSATPPAEVAPSAAAAEKPAGDVYKFVLMKTSKGDILLRLNETLAPLSTANFLQYTKDKEYDGTVFHRIINGFMIQGGGFDTTFQKRPTRAPIKNEGGNRLRNDTYTIAMARTGDPDSATNQFFINVNNNRQLNRNLRSPGYAVFGHVIVGQKVVDAIKTAPKTPREGALRDAPTEPIIIEEVRQIDLAQAEKFATANGEKPTVCTQQTTNETRAHDGPIDNTSLNVPAEKLPGTPVSGDPDGEDNGLKWWVIEPGTGEVPSSMSDTVTVHYTGYLLDGTKFDSSVDRGTPTSFPLDGVIAGWQLGVSTMKVGERKKLFIPAKPWGYGDRGTPGGPIPPNASLVFDIELIDFKPAK